MKRKKRRRKRGRKEGGGGEREGKKEREEKNSVSRPCLPKNGQTRFKATITIPNQFNSIQFQPRFSIKAFVSFGGSPVTPNARTWVPRRNRCKPTATFHPSDCEIMKTYFLPSWSRMLARRTRRPDNSPL